MMRGKAVLSVGLSQPQQLPTVPPAELLTEGR